MFTIKSLSFLPSLNSLDDPPSQRETVIAYDPPSAKSADVSRVQVKVEEGKILARVSGWSTLARVEPPRSRARPSTGERVRASHDIREVLTVTGLRFWWSLLYTGILYRTPHTLLFLSARPPLSYLLTAARRLYLHLFAAIPI